MSQAEEKVGAVGLIRVAELEITVTPLEQFEELALDRELRKATEAEAGDHYTRCRPLLDAMPAGDRLEAVREIVRLSATKAPLSEVAIFDFRCTPAGLAIELWWRGRKATPGLTREGLAAVITDENADRVAAGMFELLKGGPDKKS